TFRFWSVHDVCVISAAGDGLLENGGGGSHTAQTGFIEHALEFAAGEQRAAGIVQPNPMFGGPEAPDGGWGFFLVFFLDGGCAGHGFAPLNLENAGGLDSSSWRRFFLAFGFLLSYRGCELFF